MTDNGNDLKPVSKTTAELEGAAALLKRVMDTTRQAMTESMEDLDRRVWEIGLRLNLVSKRQDWLTRQEMANFLCIDEPDELTEALYTPLNWYWDTENRKPVYVVRTFDMEVDTGKKKINYAEAYYFDPVNQMFSGTPAGVCYIIKDNLVQIMPSCEFDL